MPRRPASSQPLSTIRRPHQPPARPRRFPLSMDLSLKAIFGMDGTGFRADLKQTMAEARSAVNSWANVVAGVGVAAVAALSKSAIEMAGRLSDTSQNLGINVEQLQVL